MISLSAYMGFGQRLDNFFLLRRDGKFSESRGIPIDVLDVGNRKFSYTTCQPSVNSGPLGNERTLLTPKFVAVTESWYSRAAEDQVIFIHLSRILASALDLI